MTTRDIQRRLMVERYRRNFCLPNYTPKGWWECDVFELTKNGYFVEYEIKLTIGDFKADGKKQRIGWLFNPATRLIEYPKGPNKHQQIAQADPKGPCRFWFVCPDNLITREVLPAWSGLIFCRRIEGCYAPWNVHLEVAVEAPQLHHSKCDEKVIQHAQSVCYYRFQNLFLPIRNL